MALPLFFYDEDDDLEEMPRDGDAAVAGQAADHSFYGNQDRNGHTNHFPFSQAVRFPGSETESSQNIVELTVGPLLQMESFGFVFGEPG